MAQSELKPCPFCGSTDLAIEKKGTWEYRVSCDWKIYGTQEQRNRNEMVAD